MLGGAWHGLGRPRLQRAGLHPLTYGLALARGGVTTLVGTSVSEQLVGVAFARTKAATARFVDDQGGSA
ncbi:MAG: hypothetical protein ACR2LI_06610 [Propionibacteriaceae bacterium]